LVKNLRKRSTQRKQHWRILKMNLMTTLWLLLSYARAPDVYRW